MENELKTLQLFYASVLADSVCHYNDAGILNLVTEKKAGLQELTAASQLKQLGIRNPEQFFAFASKVFGCIQWECHEGENRMTFKGNHCLLCSLAKKRQTAQPCFIYCINPFKSFMKAMAPSYHLSVEQTLWDSDHCEFNLQLSQ